MNEIFLNNGVKIPLLGFGVFQITDQEICEQSVLAALKTGYRMVDTAACYGNEKAVGRAIQKSGIDRKKTFLVGFRMQDMKKQNGPLKGRFKICKRTISICT